MWLMSDSPKLHNPVIINKQLLVLVSCGHEGAEYQIDAHEKKLKRKPLHRKYFSTNSWKKLNLMRQKLISMKGRIGLILI